MRKAITGATLSALFLIAGGASAADPVCGDVNSSSSVTSSDALLVLKKAVQQPITLDCSAYDDQFLACETSVNACNAGTAAVGDVLAGKSFSSSAGLGVVGTMPNIGTATLLPSTTDQAIAAGYHNGAGKCAGDAELLSANILHGVNLFGVAGELPRAQVLKTGATVGSGPSDDGSVQAGAPRSFTDNGDGTITDNTTGLMWEKKDDFGGLHDQDNTYTWTSVRCTGLADGTLFTIFLPALNAGDGFAGYTDWRIPNRFELESLYSMAEVGPPYTQARTHPEFLLNCEPGCTATSCSCTSILGTWTSTDQINGACLSYLADFDSTLTTTDWKDELHVVRAVRGGL